MGLGGIKERRRTVKLERKKSRHKEKIRPRNERAQQKRRGK